MLNLSCGGCHLGFLIEIKNENSVRNFQMHIHLDSVKGKGQSVEQLL